MMAPHTQNGSRTLDQRVDSLEEEMATTRADLLVVAGRLENKVDRLLERKSLADEEQDTRITQLENASKLAADAATANQAAASKTAESLPQLAAVASQAHAATALLNAAAEKLPPDSWLRRNRGWIIVAAFAAWEIYKSAKGAT